MGHYWRRLKDQFDPKVEKRVRDAAKLGFSAGVHAAWFLYRGTDPANEQRLQGAKKANAKHVERRKRAVERAVELWDRGLSQRAASEQTASETGYSESSLWTHMPKGLQRAPAAERAERSSC